MLGLIIIKLKDIGDCMAIYASDIDISKCVDNILSVLDLGSDHDIMSGRSWYCNAHDLAADLAQDYDITIGQSAGIMACFSIDSTWQQTIKDTVTWLDSRGQVTVGRYSMVRRKAFAILSGGDIRKALGNKKIYCFWQNIVNPLENTRVTIDRHAAKIAIEPYENIGNTVDRAWYQTIKKYNRLETCYRHAADLAGYDLAHEIQAVTWVIYRKLFVKTSQG